MNFCFSCLRYVQCESHAVLSSVTEPDGWQRLHGRGLLTSGGELATLDTSCTKRETHPGW